VDMNHRAGRFQPGPDARHAHEREDGSVPDRTRPPTHSYDVVVLGAGPGGEVAARGGLWGAKSLPGL
jgi:hypothetical protein